MTAQNKTTIKSYFQTGDHPTQGEFADLVDSYQDAAANLGVLSSAAAPGAVGLQLLSCATSASAASIVGVQAAGAVGAQLYAATTTATATSVLGGGAAGVQIFSATTTAAVFSQLGAGTVGTQIFQATTTAQANNALTEDCDFTPGLQFTSGTATLSTAIGTGFRRGREVSVTCTVIVASVSSPSGVVQVTNLPYPQINIANNRSAPGIYCTGFLNTFTGHPVAYVDPSGSSFVFQEFAAGAVTNPGAKFTAGTQLTLTLTYETSA